MRRGLLSSALRPVLGLLQDLLPQSNRAGSASDDRVQQQLKLIQQRHPSAEWSEGAVEPFSNSFPGMADYSALAANGGVASRVATSSDWLAANDRNVRLASW